MPVPLSRGFKRFRALATTSAVLILVSFVLFQVGRDKAALVAISSVLSTAGTIAFIAAVLLRWRGPWQEDQR